MPEVWRKWNWSERFPGREEIIAYFRHVDSTLNLSKDVSYSADVVHVRYDKAAAKWHVQTEDGRKAVCTYLICATGSSFKPHYPAFENLDAFRGQLVHSTRYPEVANTKGKRVAIVGSGATAVQVTQEVAKEAKHLTVYVRTASISLPMYQRKLTKMEQRVNKSFFPSLLKRCRHGTSGLSYDGPSGSIYDLNEAEREDL